MDQELSGPVSPVKPKVMPGSQGLKPALEVRSVNELFSLAGRGFPERRWQCFAI